MDRIYGTISGTQAITGELAGKQGISGQMNRPNTVYENDYEKLRNHPSLDGREIIGDIEEKDPTVPDWAKEPDKPVYTAEEIGALAEDNEMSAATMVSIWQSIFNK